MGLYSNTEYVFHRTKEPSEWTGAKSHELLVLSGIFQNGLNDEVALSELQNRFYRNLPGIRSALFDSMVEHGYYLHRPDMVRQFYIGGGVVTGVLLFAIGQYAAQQLGTTPLPFVVGAILTGAVIAGFGWIRLVHARAHCRRSSRATQRARLRGFSFARGSGPYGPHRADAGYV
jgi:hypothetical protein